MENKKQQDGYGNKISVYNLDELKSLVNNECMWVNGDRIQVQNKSGCVINTIVIKDKRLAK